MSKKIYVEPGMYKLHYEKMIHDTTHGQYTKIYMITCGKTGGSSIIGEWTESNVNGLRMLRNGSDEITETYDGKLAFNILKDLLIMSETAFNNQPNRTV